MQDWGLWEYGWAGATALLGFLMWATQVNPKQAVSNLAEWARTFFGIQDPPDWLKSPDADRIVRHIAVGAMVLLCLTGMFLFFGAGSMRTGPKLTMVFGFLCVAVAVGWNFFQPATLAPSVPAVTPSSVKPSPPSVPPTISPPAIAPIAQPAPLQRPPGTIDPLTMRPHVKDPYPEGPILARRFSRNQANAMIDAVQRLRDVARKAMELQYPLDLFVLGTDAHRRHRPEWKEKIRADGFDATIATLNEFIRKISAVSSQMEHVQQEDAYSHFTQDLMRIRGDTGMNPLLENLGRYIHLLEILKKESPDGNVNIRLLDITLSPIVSDWPRVWADFNRWRGSFVIERTIEAERQLQQFL